MPTYKIFEMVGADPTEAGEPANPVRSHVNTIVATPEWITASRLDAELVEDEVPPVQPQPRHVTRLAFLRRFSDQEAIALDLASLGATPQAAAMRRYLSLVNAAAFVDLDDPATRGGVQALEAAGVVMEGRAVAILDAPVAESERWGR
jgi:hypothetical protein